MIGWQDDNGQPFFQKIDPKDLAIVCGPLTCMAIKTAVGAKFINETDNMFEGFVGRILQTNYIPVTGAEAADWYLAYTGGPNRPLIYSRFRLRTDEEMQDTLNGAESASPFKVTMEDLRNLSSVELLTNLGNRGADNSDSYVILNEEFLLAARFRGEVTYGPPWYMVRVENAAS